MTSAQCDFCRDTAQIQANETMLQETQNCLEDGAADEVGWSLFRAEKKAKTMVAVRNKK